MPRRPKPPPDTDPTDYYLANRGKHSGACKVWPWDANEPAYRRMVRVPGGDPRSVFRVACEDIHGEPPGTRGQWQARRCPTTLDCWEGLHMAWIRKGAKLTDAEVARVRELCAAGVTHGQIARQFEVSKGLVCAISAGHHRPV